MLNKIINPLTRIDDGYAKLERFVLVALTLLMLVLTGGNVFARLLGTGFPWADESGRFLMVWVGFLGASVATRRRRHITIDVLNKSMNERQKAFSAMITDLLGAIVCLSLMVVGVVYVMRNREFNDLSPALKMSYWKVQIIIPIGLGIIGSRFGLRSLVDLQALLTGDYEPLSKTEESLF